MDYPDFFKAFPELEIPFPSDVVTTRAVRSDQGTVVFFDFHKDMVLPLHSHLGQCGTVLTGEVEMTIGDVTRTMEPGEFYDIPAGVVHGATIKAGAKIMDVFEEPDRYPLKA